MMLTTLIKTLLLPPALQLLMIVWGLLWSRSARPLSRAMAWLLVSTGLVSLWVLAMPVTSAWLHKPLETGFPIYSPAKKPNGVDAIVVLGAGRHYGAREYMKPVGSLGDTHPPLVAEDTLSHSALWRLRYGAYLAKQWHVPVIVSGGNVRPFDRVSEAEMGVQFLRNEMGVPVVWPESRSRNTWENAQRTAELLRGKQITHIALVTHAYHMPRAVYAFQQAGIHVSPMPTGQYSHVVTAYWLHWLPSANGLQKSYLALHEYLGLLFYRLK